MSWYRRPDGLTSPNDPPFSLESELPHFEWWALALIAGCLIWSVAAWLIWLLVSWLRSFL